MTAQTMKAFRQLVAVSRHKIGCYGNVPWLKSTKFLAIGMFSSLMLMQQSALRSVHNWMRGATVKRKSEAEHKSASLPGGLIISNTVQKFWLAIGLK